GGGDRRPQGGDRGRGDRPFQSREGRGGEGRPPFRGDRSERPQGAGFRGGDRPRSDRPFGDRPRQDRGDFRRDRPEGAGASDPRNERRERPFDLRGDQRGRP